MTHVFVAPHPDDVALSCGGLIASLRKLGQTVTIITVFSGTGGATALSPYQREALGFGAEALWPTREASNRPQQGAIPTDEVMAARAAGDVMAARRVEDERFASFAEASIVFLDLPDAVFRGYEGDDVLLSAPRPDDTAPIDLLAIEINRLEPQKVYLPLGIGNHVDHQLVRRAGVALLERSRSGAMPGPDYAGIVTFYEDFPYAWWNEFRRLEELPAGAFDGLPAGVAIAPAYADVTDTIDRKIQGIRLYESQLGHLFGGPDATADAVRGFGAKVAGLGGVPGYAERYWASARR